MNKIFSAFGYFFVAFVAFLILAHIHTILAIGVTIFVLIKNKKLILPFIGCCAFFGLLVFLDKEMPDFCSLGGLGTGIFVILAGIGLTFGFGRD